VSMNKYEGRFVRPADPERRSYEPGFLHYWKGSRDMPAGWYVTPGWQRFCQMAQRLDDPKPVYYTADERGIRWTRSGEYIYVWGDDPVHPCTTECPAAHYENRYNISPYWKCVLAAPHLLSIEPGEHICVITPTPALIDQIHRDLATAEQQVTAAIAQRDRLAAIVAMLTARTG